MSDKRFIETFDKLCKNSKKIMEAALGEIESKGNIAICMGVHPHPQMTYRGCRKRGPQYFYYWEGDAPTDDIKENLRKRCSKAVNEYIESYYTEASSAMVLSIEDDYDFYALALFSAETDDPIEESLIADTISVKLNQLVEPIALSLPEEEEYLDSEDPEDPEEQDEYMYDASDAGHVRVYDGAHYGHLIASD